MSTLAAIIAKRMLERRKQAASVKAAPKPSTGAPKRPEPAQAAKKALPLPSPLPARNPAKRLSAPYNPPRRPEPDIRALVESFAPPPATPAPPQARLELFARRPRPGWITSGSELAIRAGGRMLG